GGPLRGDRRERARPHTNDHRGPRARPHGLEPKACAAAPRLSRRPRSDAQVRRRSDPRRTARAGPRARRYAHRPKEGRSMRFRAVRPSQLGKVDAIVIPLSAGAEPPAWLSRATRAAIARLLKEERRLPNIDQVVLVTEKATADAIDRGTAVGEATNVARRLANEPANRMTPALIAEAAKDLAKEAGVRIEVLDADRCRALGMGS